MHPLIHVPRSRLWTPRRGFIRPKCMLGAGSCGACGATGAVQAAGEPAEAGPFTPESVSGLQAWYDAIDEPATLVKAAQQEVGEWTLVEGWSGSGPTGPFVASPGVVGSMYQDGMSIIGNRVQCTYILSNYSGGSVRWYSGTAYKSPVYANGTYIHDLTTTASARDKFYPTTSGNFTLTIPSLINLSRTRWNPTAGDLGGYLSNTTATLQPWWDGEGLMFEEDELASSLSATSWNHLHTEGTLFAVVTPRAVDAAVNLFVTSEGVDPGIQFGIQADNTVTCSAWNGSGLVVDGLDSTGTVSADTLVILAWRIKAAAADIWVNGGTPDTVEPSGTPGGDSTFPFQIGYDGGLTDETMHCLLTYNRALTDVEIGQVGDYLAEEWSGTWA